MNGSRTYWLDLFTGVTWQEFLDAGGTVSGFRESRWKVVQKIRPGDYLLCYLTGVSRFIGALEVTSPAFRDKGRIWKDEDFPCRVRIRTVLTLKPETAVPVHTLRDRLSFFQDPGSRLAWVGHFRGSPTRWKNADGEAVLKALQEATESPISRPVDAKKLARRPKALRTKIGSVTVPESALEAEAPQKAPEVTAKESSEHSQIQWLLAKLGNDLGLDVWVARNDRNREVNGNRFTNLPRLQNELPLRFDAATNKTIELIDVLWLTRNSVLAAFEIESTTSIYSGLLRMSDLVSMQPNLKMPLYLVAPDDRREKVLEEVNRPTFSRLSPPLAEVCRYIAFSSLREHLDRLGSYARHLRTDFLDDLSESCEIEEA